MTKSEALVLEGKADRIFGDRPPHTHTCSQGHQWQCNSPYCEFLQADCVPHGGLEPIVPGREPWRR